MGALLTKLLDTFYAKKLEVVLVGLENSGKTTLLNVLAAGRPVETCPTIGLNVKLVRKGGVQMKCWDIGTISASRGAAVPSRHRRASSPGEEVVGGFFFDFEAIRTESSDRDAPRRSRASAGPRAWAANLMETRRDGGFAVRCCMPLAMVYK